MYKEFIDEVCDKYGYDDNLRCALKVVFPLMVNEYEDFEGVKNVFLSVRIFSVQSMDMITLESVEDIMLDNINEHIIIEDASAYGNNSTVGALYSYVPIFDKNVNVVGEAKWIVVRNMKDSFNSSGYMELFGTTINIPYLIHELNHAYAMQRPIYKVKDNKIYSKHGMYETIDEINKGKYKYKIFNIKQDNIMLEEILNEMKTQKMLCTFFGVDDFKDVFELLKGINHVPAIYNNLMIDIAKYFEIAVGKYNLMSYRKDNEYSVKEKFNLLTSQSEIGNLYFSDVEPFTYLNDNIFEMFKLVGERFKYFSSVDRIEEYKKRMLKLFYDAMAPVYSYNIINNNKGSIDDYLSLRKNKLYEDIDIHSVKK